MLNCKGCQRKKSWHIQRWWSIIFLERLRGNYENLIYSNRSLSLTLNQNLPRSRNVNQCPTEFGTRPEKLNTAIYIFRISSQTSIYLCWIKLCWNDMWRTSFQLSYKINNPHYNHARSTFSIYGNLKKKRRKCQVLYCWTMYSYRHTFTQLSTSCLI